MELNDKQLLSFSEISFILYDATDPIYLVENLFHPGFKKVDILRVSKNKGLILFQGNEITGFNHIMIRHNPVASATNWSDNGSLGESSKFSFNHTPIIHYLHIAESIFDPQNLDSGRNNEPEKFDLYLGGHPEPDGVLYEYKLLLYKDTRIIHNLYPVQKKFHVRKLLKGLNLKPVFSSASCDFKNCVHSFEIEYFNSGNLCQAKVIIISNYNKKIESWNYEIYDNEGNVLDLVQYCQFDKFEFLPLHDRQTNLKYFEDLSSIEKAIKAKLNTYL